MPGFIQEICHARRGSVLLRSVAQQFAYLQFSCVTVVYGMVKDVPTLYVCTCIGMYVCILYVLLYMHVCTMYVCIYVYL
jgi:hypothetical protein